MNYNGLITPTGNHDVLTMSFTDELIKKKY